MDKEVKKFLLKYMESVDEELYLNFMKSFSSLPKKKVKNKELSVYMKCKHFVKSRKLRMVD